MHPRCNSSRPQQPQASPIATEGTSAHALDSSYPTEQQPNTAQPPSRERHRAPSGAISPLTAAPTPPNRHRGRTSVHPRCQLPSPAAPTSNTTDAQGAIPCTLDANYLSHDAPGGSNRHPGRTGVHPRRRLSPLSRPNAAQPPPREYQRAPSDAISLPAAVLNKGNCHRGAQSHAPSVAVSPPAAPTGRVNRTRGSNPVHPREQLRSPGRKPSLPRCSASRC